MNKTRSKHIKLSLPSPYLKSRGNWQNFLLAQLDSYTRIHSLRVGRVAAKIGELLNLKSEDRLHIATAGLFHDIGKLMIDRDILYKQNPSQKTKCILCNRTPSLERKSGSKQVDTIAFPKRFCAIMKIMTARAIRSGWRDRISRFGAASSRLQTHSMRCFRLAPTANPLRCRKHCKRF